jgi:hypothetical protein
LGLRLGEAIDELVEPFSGRHDGSLCSDDTPTA